MALILKKKHKHFNASQILRIMNTPVVYKKQISSRTVYIHLYILCMWVYMYVCDTIILLHRYFSEVLLFVAHTVEHWYPDPWSGSTRLGRGRWLISLRVYSNLGRWGLFCWAFTFLGSCFCYRYRYSLDVHNQRLQASQFECYKYLCAAYICSISVYFCGLYWDIGHAHTSNNHLIEFLN